MKNSFHLQMHLGCLVFIFAALQLQADVVSMTLSRLPNVIINGSQEPRVDILSVDLGPQGPDLVGQPGEVVGWSFKINWASNAGDSIVFNGSTLNPSEQWSQLGDYVDLIGALGGNQDESVLANTQWSSPEPFVASTDGIGYFTIKPDAVPGTRYSGILPLEFKVYRGSGDNRVKIGSYSLPLEVSITVGAVEAMEQTITFPEITDKAITAAPFALGGESDRDLPLMYISLNPDLCTIENGIASVHGSGRVGIVAIQEGNARYSAARPVTRYFEILKNPATITIQGDMEQDYDANEKLFTAVTEPAGLDVTWLYNGESTPPRAPGIYVINALAEGPNYTGTSQARLTITDTRPVPVSLSLTQGSTLGGNSVTITGSNFIGATAVTFGGINATNFTVDSATEITATTPAGTAGPASVVITTAIGSNAENTLFTYVAPPTVTHISPAIGTTGGGTSVTITGTNFTGTTSVAIGGTAATIGTITDTTITATTPAGAAGPASIRVTTPGGTNAANTLFTYGLPPTDITLTPASIAENNAANAVVGTLDAVDADLEDTHTFTLASGGTDNDDFTITGSTLSIKEAADFEAKPSYSIRVQANDGNGGIYERSLTINVTDVNDAPTDIALAGSSVAENSALNAAVGTFSSTDQDTGSSFTYSLVSGLGGTGNGSFNISGNALRANAGIDYEAGASRSIRVRTMDQGGLLFEKEFIITITDVNEMPSFVKGADQLLPYNTSSAQTATGWATAIADGDSTVTQTLTFNISSNSNPDIFTTAPSIDSSTGTLTYTPNGTAGTATIGVTLTDDGSINGNAALTTLEQTFTITVEPVPDYTVATAGNAIVVTDLSGNGDSLAVSEPSAGNIQFAAAGRTFSVNGGLQIVGNSGVISRTSVTAITVNAAAGADTINVGAFTGTLPSLTINGGTGIDTVNVNGALSLNNDDFTVTADVIGINSTVATGTGTIMLTTVDGNIAVSGMLTATGSISLVAGGLNSDVTVTGGIDAIRSIGSTVNIQAGHDILLGSGGADGDVRSDTSSVTLNADHDIVISSSTYVQGASLSAVAGHDFTLQNMALFNGNGGGSVTVTTGSGGTLTISTSNGSGGSRGINTNNGVIILTTDTLSLGATAELNSGGSAAINLISDSMLISATASINSSTGNTTLRQRTNGTLINLGAVDSAGTLGLMDTELDRITAGTLNIGDADSGAITVSAAITRSAATVIDLTSGANIDLSTGSLDSAGGNVTLNPGTNLFASNGGVDVTTGAAASLTIPSGDTLRIVIDGDTADTEHTQLNVAGLIDLTGAVLSLSGGYTAVVNDILTIVNNDGTDAVTGTFSGLAEGAKITFNGIPLTISYVGGSGNDVTLSYLNEIVVHDGSHGLAPELSDGQVAVVNFGSTAPNVASVRSFTVRNTGDAELAISSIAVPTGYRSNGSAVTLASGASYTFQVALESATPGTYAGSITINCDDLDEAAFDFPVTGTVVAPGSAPVVNVVGDVAVQGSTGSAVLGGPAGSTLFSFIGSPALNSSGVLASAVQIRHADASLHTGMMVGQPLVLIATDTQTAPSLPGVNHFNFGPPVINEAGHVAFIGEVRGAGITANVNSRCLFSNASDGTLKLVARAGTNVGLTSTLKTIGNFSIGGDLVIFLGTLVDNSVVLFGWDSNTGLRALMRNGQSLDANGVSKTVKSFSVLENTNASSGHGKDISVAPTGESLVTIGVTFTDNSSGVVVGSFDGTSDTGFGATYGASQQFADTYASPAVIPLARWSTFRSPGFDNTGSYYGFISQMVTNALAGVSSTNNVGIFVDTAPGNLTLQLRENDVATGTGGLVFSDFSDLVLGGGDYEFLVKGELRGSGVVGNVNDKGLWAQHATNGLVLVAREGSEAPGVAGSSFFRLTQIALPGTAQPMFQASMRTGTGGVTTANDTGLWVINEANEVKLAVREGDVINIGGTDRTVTAITALLNGTTTGGALGRRVFLADGQLTLLLTFSGGIQANAKVVVP
jgi:hypothetical protein